jgi:ribonuclease HIII
MQNSSSHTQKLLATTAQINEMLEYYEGYLTYNTNNYMIARVKIATVTITLVSWFCTIFSSLIA